MGSYLVILDLPSWASLPSEHPRACVFAEHVERDYVVLEVTGFHIQRRREMLKELNSKCHIIGEVSVVIAATHVIGEVKSISPDECLIEY